MVQASATNHDVYDALKTNCNILQQNIRVTKKLYYNKTFLLYTIFFFLTWSTIKKTLNLINDTKYIPLKYHNDTIIRDPIELANALN